VRIFEISNRIVTSVFDSKRAQLFEIFKYLPSPISYLFNRMKFHTLACPGLYRCFGKIVSSILLSVVLFTFLIYDYFCICVCHRYLKTFFTQKRCNLIIISLT